MSLDEVHDLLLLLLAKTRKYWERNCSREEINRVWKITPVPVHVPVVGLCEDWRVMNVDADTVRAKVIE